MHLNLTIPFCQVVGDRAHVEKAHGSEEQCRAYCTKEETRVSGPWELGRLCEGQGERTDLKEVTEAIKGGKRASEIALSHPEVFVRNVRGLRALEAVVNEPTFRPDIETLYIWGPTGVGKSWIINELFPNAYWKPPPPAKGQGDWWDGYAFEQHVVLDDFKGDEQYPLGTIQRYLDPYKLRLPVKGDFIAARYTRVVITSQHPPEWWYKPNMVNGLYSEENQAAWLRRCTHVVHMETREDGEKLREQAK